MKEEIFIITIVSSQLAPPLQPPLEALKCPAFSTHLKSPPRSPRRCPSLLESQSSGKSPLRLLSSFCLPCQWAHTVSAGWGDEGRRRAGWWFRERKDEGEKADWRASGCRGECTWMGRLPGHAVRGYCPSCQQPLAFNGARISSF